MLLLSSVGKIHETLPANSLRTPLVNCSLARTFIYNIFNGFVINQYYKAMHKSGIYPCPWFKDLV